MTMTQEEARCYYRARYAIRNGIITQMQTDIEALEGEFIDMKNTYNLRDIMGKAWDIYRANLDNADGLRPVFSICLQMAWEHVKNNPVNVLSQWDEMSDENKVRFLTACVKTAAKNEIVYSTEDHYNQYNETVLWFLRSHGIDSLVNEAYCKLAERLSPDYLGKLNARRAEKGLMNASLTTLVYRAAKDAIRAVYRDDIKHGCASVRTVKDKDGAEHSYIDTVVSSRKDNTETSAIIRSALAEFVAGRDDIDRMIVEGKRDGYTEREIASIVGISGPAIHKRIDKIREALRNAGLAPYSVA